MNHMAKLRPEIERLCRLHNFKYYVEENEGRILVKFGEGQGQLTQDEATNFWDGKLNYGAPPAPAYEEPKPQAWPQQQFGTAPNQGAHSDNIVEQIVTAAAPVVAKKLGCCIIL